MKAVLLTGHGGPEMLEYREDVPIPEVGPNEVLVRVGACGMNNTDIWTREGAYGDESNSNAVSTWRREPFSFPRIQGLDIVGYIQQVGAQTDPDRIGERVLVDPTIYTGDSDGLFDASILGSERDGGFAEYVAVPAENAHPINSPLSDVELATFPCAYITAEHMLNRARVAQGETVLITGASGGVGSALVQLTHQIRRSRVVAIVGQGKEELLQRIGADIVITRQTENLHQAITNAIGQQAIDVVADIVGGTQFPTLLRVLRPGGRYVTAGAIAGAMVSLDLRTLYLKHLELIGSTLGTRQEFANLVGFIESGMFKPLVAQTYPLRDIRQAQADFQAKQFVGNLVLVP